MRDKELVQTIFIHQNIEQKKWLFDADIDWNTVDIEIDNYITWNKGTWKDGTWEGNVWKAGVWKGGLWKKGLWQGGTWIKGKIYNPKTGKYQESTLPPNKCPWSLSYEK
jgi:hypothetical protein